MRNPKARAVRSARMRVAFARSRDANEPAILYAVRTAGWYAAKLSETGLPDVLCLHPDGLRAVLLEVKVPGGRRLKSGRLSQPGRLTPAQQDMHARLARAGWTVHVVHTPQEALKALMDTTLPAWLDEVKPPATQAEALRQLREAGIDRPAFLARVRANVAKLRTPGGTP